MSDEQRSHEPQRIHRHHSTAQNESVITGGGHGGHHVEQPTVGEDAKENPAEGWDPAEPEEGESTERHSMR